MKWEEGEWETEPWPEADPVLPGGWDESQLKLALFAQRRGHATNLPDLSIIAWWLTGKPIPEEQNVTERRSIPGNKDFTPKYEKSNGGNEYRWV